MREWLKHYNGGARRKPLLTGVGLYSPPVFLPLGRFLRERRAHSKSLVCRATQTIASALAPAGVARIRVRNYADH